MSLKLIERIEFHEIRNRYSRRAIETRFYVKDIKEFLRWCVESQGGYYSGRKFDEAMYDYYLGRVSKWKKPKFEMYISGNNVFVYPRDGYVAVRVGGLHYICQHSFDIIPRGREVFYGNELEKLLIGKLYPLPKRGLKPMDVTNVDILKGFMLHREQVDGYRDDFVLFIRSRRENDEQK